MSENSQQSVQSIIDNLHSAVIVIDSCLKVECMNPSAEMLFHISTKRATGRLLAELIPNEPDFFDRLTKSTKSQHPYTVYDATLTRHHGDTITMDYMVSPIEYNQTGLFLLLEFIPKGRHHKIAQENQLLKQNDASRNLLRGLAHEIKNPLGGLRGAAQLLERKLAEDDKEYTHIIIQEADRLRTLVDRMLGPKELPNKTGLNIHQVLEHVRQLVEAENNPVKFVADYDPSIPEFFGDESMLIQAILNITRNAVSALMESNTPDAEITYRTRSIRNSAIGSKTHPLVIKVGIVDNGPGIPEDIIDQIFFPMVTGRADGTGLGLSIAQSLIHQHEGLIECTSKPNKTTFTILFPLVNEND